MVRMYRLCLSLSRTLCLSLSDSLSFCVSLYLSLCLSFCLSLSNSLFLSFCVCLSISHVSLLAAVVVEVLELPSRSFQHPNTSTNHYLFVFIFPLDFVISSSFCMFSSGVSMGVDYSSCHFLVSTVLFLSSTRGGHSEMIVLKCDR